MSASGFVGCFFFLVWSFTPVVSAFFCFCLSLSLSFFFVDRGVNKQLYTYNYSVLIVGV